MAMTATHDTMSEREEIEMLLPWYVTGKLSATDQARVDDWLKREPSLARQLDLIRDEQHQTLRSHDSVALPSGLSVAQTLAKLPAPRPTVGQWVQRITEATRDMFAAPLANGARWAAVAAVTVIISQAAALGWMTTAPTTAPFQTASGGTTAGDDGSYALIRFADTATAKDIAATLTTLNMSIADGPRAGGIFRIRIGAKSATQQQRLERITALRDLSTLIVFAAPIP
jgi:anti-sigma factor RsiW